MVKLSLSKMNSKSRIKSFNIIAFRCFHDVLYLGLELEAWGLERVVLGECDAHVEEAACVWAIGGAHDLGSPSEHVVAFRARGA